MQKLWVPILREFQAINANLIILYNAKTITNVIITTIR